MLGCVCVCVTVHLQICKLVCPWRQWDGERACQTFASVPSQIPLLSAYLDAPVHPGNACSHASMHHQHLEHKHTALITGQAFLLAMV